MKSVLFLGLAILSEVMATTALKYSEGFIKWFPSILVVVGYGAAFYLLSISLKVIPIGVAYSVWSGVGIVLIAIIGYFMWNETMDWAKGLGIFLIIIGVVLVNLVSGAPGH
jgi:small multidrug resistance pump